MVKVSINQKTCIGCDMCSKNAPGLFVIDKNDFKCKVKDNEKLTTEASLDVSDDSINKIKKAAKDCPTKSLNLSE